MAQTEEKNHILVLSLLSVEGYQLGHRNGYPVAKEPFPKGSCINGLTYQKGKCPSQAYEEASPQRDLCPADRWGGGHRLGRHSA